MRIAGRAPPRSARALNLPNNAPTPTPTKPAGIWSGYFSSRPALKHLVRYASTVFAAGRQLQAFTGGVGDALAPSNPLFALERALATADRTSVV